MNNSDKPINPCIMQQTGENSFRASKENDPKEYKIPTEGLTKREYFAGLVLSGLCANYLRDNVQGWNIKSYAVEAVELADELLKQLEQK